MSLREILTDRSSSLAKQRSNDEVTEQHVVVAVMEFFAEPRGPVSKAEIQICREALPAPGNAVKPPSVSAAAERLLAKCTSQDEALAAVSQTSTASVSIPVSTVSATTDPPSTAPSDAQPPEEILAEALVQLSELVGLSVVKEQVSRLVAVQQFNLVRESEGLPRLGAGLHLVFTGAPGTGKTTVARLVARIYRGLGLLSQGHLVETSRADLVAGYVGQTALKTQEVIQRALGGVLFIDEAYALTPAYGEDFSSEAVATLVKAMEDHRGDFAVIAAGYTDEMTAFVAANPGLKSRFQNFLEFPNYSKDELVDIFVRLAAKNKVESPPEVLAALRDSIEGSARKASEGNARFVRSIFEDMTARMALRAAEDGHIDPEEVHSFAVSDVPGAAGDSGPGIGFT